jgi:D-lactate dehydrogenase (cytochrome)
LRSKFDNIPANAEAALFFENDILREEEYDLTLEAWYGYLEGMSVLLDDSWFAQTPGDLRRFNDFRHAIPALLNEENSRRGRIKMGTDMAVSDNRLIEMMDFYKDMLEKQDVDYAVFGHLGDNHLHINLLPESDQIDKAQDIYNELVKQILEWNGTVSAEHGIGKLKKKYFSQMLGQSSLEELKALKSSFDPDFILGRGNIL